MARIAASERPRRRSNSSVHEHSRRHNITAIERANSSTSVSTHLRHNPVRKCRESNSKERDQQLAIPIIDQPTQMSYQPHELREMVQSVFGYPAQSRSPSPLSTFSEPFSSREAFSVPVVPPPSKSFRFLDLPRELRDEIYSHLVLVDPSRRCHMFSARLILYHRKQREKVVKTRNRLNAARLAAGKRPIPPKTKTAKPWVDTSIFLVSKQLYAEARDYMYTFNWFAVSMDTFNIGRSLHEMTKCPVGWDVSRITKMQLELQLKDAKRMNRYVDWTRFFSWFTSLRKLTIIPTFSFRYWAWTRAELKSWNGAGFVWRAFFWALLDAIPAAVAVKLGKTARENAPENWECSGMGAVDRSVLRKMVEDFHGRMVTKYGSCPNIFVEYGPDSDRE